MNKKLTNTDSKLADKGWADMQRILDREMPVERRRRPFLWFFWGAAALLGAGITAWWLWTGTQNISPLEPKEKAFVSDQPVASAKEQTQSRLNTPGPALEAVKTAPSAAYIHGTSPTIGQNASVMSRQAKPSNSALASNTTLPSEAPAPTLSILSELPLSAGQNNIPSSAPPSISINTEQNNLLPEQSLALLPAPQSKLPIPSRELRAFRPKFSGQSVIRNPQSAIYASAHLNPSTGAVLPSAGLLADWRWSRRFGLRAGIGYQYEHFNARNQPGTLLSEKAYLGITGDERVLDNNAFTPSDPMAGSSSTRNVLVPVASIHRLEMPLQVFWQAHPRWRAYAGFQLQYAFHAKGTGSVIELDSSRVLNLPNSELSNQLAGEQTRGWTTYLSAGFGYQFNRHLELGMLYRWIPGGNLNSRLAYDSQSVSSGNQLDTTAERLNNPSTGRQQLQLQMIWKF